MEINVFIADDQTFLVDAFNICIQTTEDIVFAGSAASPDELRSRLKNKKVDVLLLDFFPEKADFLELIREISSQYPMIRILILSGRHKQFYALSKEGIEAGAQGVIDKAKELSLILDSIRKVFYSPGLRIIDYTDPDGEGKIGYQVREELLKGESKTVALPIISLLCKGFRNNDEIANLMNSLLGRDLKAATVQKHRSNIMRKLKKFGVTSLTSLGFWVAKWNLLDGSELSPPSSE